MSSSSILRQPISALALLAGVVACAGDRRVGAAAWDGSIDTLDGVVTVNNPAAPLWSEEDAWRLEEDLSIGELEGDPNYEFSSILHLEVDEQGKVYVLDGQAQRISVYDADGVFLKSFGRQGEGPGEFELPGRLMWRADTLVVWDVELRRFSYFDREGDLLRDERVDLPFYFSQFEFRPDGQLWMQVGPMYGMPGGEESEGIGWILLVDRESESADTLVRWRDDTSVTVRTENFLTVLPRYYAPRLEWTVAADGTLFIARGEQYEIEVYSPEGERVKTIRREYVRRPPSPAERQEALAWIEERVERYGPVAIVSESPSRSPTRSVRRAT